MKKYFSLLLTSILLIAAATTVGLDAAAKTKKMPHVLIIGIDGLGAHGVGMANTPHLDELMKNGSYSLAARTIMPTSSGPAWSSMFTGTTVERHGVGSNAWTVGNKPFDPVVKGKYDMFPTIFGEIREHVPNAVIGAIYHWKRFVNFIESDVCDLSISCESAEEATRKACDFLKEKRPHFTFVHLDLVDRGGHHGGYRSEEYARSIGKADSLVGILIGQLRDIDLLGQTVVFVVSDHGGLEKTHGGASSDEMIVPFFISGKGVKKGYEMDTPVFTYDLAPTVGWLFGFKLNDWITGKPLKNVFSK